MTVFGSGEVGKIESVKVRNGLREAVVTVTLVGKPNDAREDSDRIVQQFSRVIGEQVGIANPYYGRCKSAEVVTVNPVPLGDNLPSKGRAITARMVFKSKPIVGTD